MKTIAILAVVGILAASYFTMTSSNSNAEEQFRAFLETNRVGYGTTEEYNYRLSVFEQNLETIARLNQENPLADFGVNQFADQTTEEMESRMGLQVPAARLNQVVVHRAPVNGKSVDWTSMWSSVKNQGSCGSCWAFSATAAFEARHALTHGSKVCESVFAEQELVDCDTKSSGCNGGWMDFAFEYLQTKEFCTESKYPYHARDETCKQSTLCSGGPKDKSFSDFTAGDEDSMLADLVNGPISVAVDAGSWSSYRGGVLTSCGTRLNHGVTLIKSDFEASTPAATIRNSWGGSWGESGHIRLAIGKNTCGYSNASSVPTF